MFEIKGTPENLTDPSIPIASRIEVRLDVPLHSILISIFSLNYAGCLEELEPNSKEAVSTKTRKICTC